MANRQLRAQRLELLGALFGWVWLLSIPFSLWFFAAAAFGAGSWKRLFASLAVGFVAKSMLRGFEAHKRRIIFERELVDRGIPEDLAKELAYIAMNRGEAALHKRLAELGVELA